MADQPIRLKVQPLTAESFRPYGQMLENKQPIFPEVEPGEGRVAIELLKLKRPSNPRRISMMATHFSYNQTFIPVRGTPSLRQRAIGALDTKTTKSITNGSQLSLSSPARPPSSTRARGTARSPLVASASLSTSRARTLAKAQAVSTRKCGWTAFLRCVPMSR
jgi:hypothetical protein